MNIPRQDAMNDLRAAQSLIERAMVAIQAMPMQRKNTEPKQGTPPPMLGSNARPENDDDKEQAT